MSYDIIDEPKASAAGHLTVSPMWPLLAVMFVGAWFSWLWFAVNGFALGSPTRRRELLLAIAGMAGNFLILLGLSKIAQENLVTNDTLRYLAVSLTVWKLGVSYGLFILQSRTFGLWQYFGGQAKNGLLIVLAGSLVGGRLLATLPETWQMILR